MANTPRKAKDPTEAALAAIQDAMSVNESAGKSKAGAPNIEIAEGARPAPASADSSFAPESLLPGEPRRAANDDSRPIGQLLQTMQPHARRSSYGIATFASILWCAAVSGLLLYFPPDFNANISLTTFSLVATFVLPVLLFFMLANMANRAREMRHVARAMADVAMRLVEPEIVGRESVMLIGQAVRREVAGMSDGIERVLARATELESMVQNEVSALERAFSDNEARIHNLLDSLARQRDNLVGQAEQVRDAITGVHLNLNQEIDSISENVASKVNQAAQVIVATLNKNSEHFTQSLEETGNSMLTSLSTRSDELLQRLELASHDTASVIETTSQQSAQILAEAATEITNGLVETSARVAETLTARSDELLQRLELTNHDTASVIEATSQKSAQILTEATAKISDGLIETSARVAETLTARSDEFNAMLRTTGDSLAFDFSLRGDDFADKIAKTADSIQAGIDSRLKLLEQTFSSDGEMEKRLVQLEETLLNRTSEVELALLSATTELAQAFNVDSSPLLAKLDEKAQAFSTAIENTVQNIALQMEGQSADFGRLLETEGENATIRVKAILGDMQGFAQSAISDMLQANEKLNTETSGLFERTREANLLLQETLSGAHETLYTLEGSLTNRIAEMTNAVDDVIARAAIAGDSAHSNLDAFRNETGRALDNLAQMSAQFDQHGRVLGETVTQIAERQNTISPLIAELDEKAAGFEQQLARFSAILRESTKAAGEQVREASEQIQYADERMHHASERIQKAGERMQDVGEQIEGIGSRIYSTSESAMEMLGDSSEQFSEMLQDLRKTAEGIKHELDRTRSELRRGILELPQEAADSTAQMRRLIVEQIDALAELNHIVAQHSQGERTRESRQDKARFAAPAPRNAARMEEQPSLPPLSPLSPSHHSEAPAPTADAQPNRWLSELLHRTDDKKPAPRERNTTSSASSTRKRASSSASPQPQIDDRRSEDQGSRVSIERLDALSGDIARLVDHHAVVEAWERYKRGDSKAFGKNIYTPQGRRAFDDIQARYQNSVDFRQTVDRYIAEFERLLDDVSRDDRGGQQMVRTYLISETGKVYTLLAHATDRLD